MRPPTWSTACLDWRERIVAGKSLLPCGALFPDEAAAALDIFRSLKIIDVLGKPTFGEVARPWVFDLPTAVFGAYNPETGRREINRFFELISKKNGKSTKAAGIMLTALLLNWRHSASFTILAPTIEIAKNSADPAMDMVAEDPELRRFLKPIVHERTIKHLETNATLKIVAADSETVGGSKATGVLIDELWLFGKRANAKNMFREAMGGLKSRPEGFVIALSTQSDEPPAGVFLDWLRRFRDIRDGKITVPRSLGLLYEFPEEMVRDTAYKDPKNFYITNPNLGASVDEQSLLDDLDEATREGQKSLVGFFAKHANVEPGMGARSDNWAGAEHWKKRADSAITLEVILERCEVVVVGLDGGGLDDLYGLTVVGRETREVDVEVKGDDGAVVKRREKRWLSWSHAWCHKGVLDRRKSIATVLEEFEKAGELTIVGDELNDISDIVDVIRKVKDAGILYCVAVDPAGIGEMVDALAEIDILEENKEAEQNFVIGAPQGFALMNAIKTAERKLANGTLLHADQAVMDWTVSNLKIEPTATAIRATKQNAGDAKIDPAMALFNAVTVMSRNPDAPSGFSKDYKMPVWG
ncbi:MAG: terminase TerL endonuclease subunit [Rhizomicrobium sp.]